MCHSLCTHPRSTHIKLSGQSQRNHPRFAASLHTHHSSYVSFSVHNYYKYTVACRREGRLKRSIHTHSLTRRPPTPSLMPNFFSFRVCVQERLLLPLLSMRPAVHADAAQSSFSYSCQRPRGPLCQYIRTPSSVRQDLSLASMPMAVFNHECVRTTRCMQPCCRARLPSWQWGFACLRCWRAWRFHW